MPWQFRFHPLAKEDYKAAYTWYEDQQSGLGERFGKAIRQKLWSYSTFVLIMYAALFMKSPVKGKAPGGE